MSRLGSDLSVRFSTYATYWIKQSMRRAVINQGRLLRVPIYLVSLTAKW
jgi:RNA polymerase primary sigma factor